MTLFLLFLLVAPVAFMTLMALMFVAATSPRPRASGALSRRYVPIVPRSLYTPRGAALAYAPRKHASRRSQSHTVQSHAVQSHTVRRAATSTGRCRAWGSARRKLRAYVEQAARRAS